MPKIFIVLSCFENQTFIFLEQNTFLQITKWYCFFLQGILVHFTASLLEMSDWGGTDTESLEKGITHIFSDAVSIPLDVKDFKMKLVCCTSDGASVNFGAKTGLMTRLLVQQPWMIKIHCVNHRVELAIKEAIAETEFSKVDDFYYL